jgi:TonB family protein
MRDIRRLSSQVIPVNVASVPAGKSGDLITQIDLMYAAEGYLKAIVVAESSGSSALDAEALSIARSNRYPDMPKELPSRDFAVRFPIVFRPSPR